MQNEILIYILYAMAVITVILAFKRYELQYHLTDYVYPHCPSKKLRILKLLDAFNTVMTILASAVPIKFRYYEKEGLIIPSYIDEFTEKLLFAGLCVIILGFFLYVDEIIRFLFMISLGLILCIPKLKLEYKYERWEYLNNLAEEIANQK